MFFSDHPRFLLKYDYAILLFGTLLLIACTSSCQKTNSIGSLATSTAETLNKSSPTNQFVIATATPDITSMTLNRELFKSPDEQWSLEVISALPITPSGEFYADEMYERVHISNSQNTIQWTLIEQWTEIGIGMGGYEPLVWTPDGEFLYFTYKPVPGGCGLFVNGSNLFKTNLATGETIEVVPNVGLWLSLSPDQSLLAYIGYGERGLVIRDLVTGNEQNVALDFSIDPYAAGHIVWDPDGKALALTLAIRPCSGDIYRQTWAEKTSVILVDIATLQSNTLIDNDKRLMVTTEWPTSEKIVLQDGEGVYWLMNIQNGQLTMKP